jgi:hypothetical protein
VFQEQSLESFEKDLHSERCAATSSSFRGNQDVVVFQCLVSRRHAPFEVSTRSAVFLPVVQSNEVTQGAIVVLLGSFGRAILEILNLSLGHNKLLQELMVFGHQVVLKLRAGSKFRNSADKAADLENVQAFEIPVEAGQVKMSGTLAVLLLAMFRKHYLANVTSRCFGGGG